MAEAKKQSFETIHIPYVAKTDQTYPGRCLFLTLVVSFDYDENWFPLMSLKEKDAHKELHEIRVL